jgi:hypothetical protein
MNDFEKLLTSLVGKTITDVEFLDDSENEGFTLFHSGGTVTVLVDEDGELLAE